MTRLRCALLCSVLIAAVAAPAAAARPHSRPQYMAVRKPLPAPRDRDHDGMPDRFERRYGLNPRDRADAVQDTDGDGLINRDEARLRLDPTKADSDGDGTPDWDDQPYTDADADGMPDFWERRYGLNPYSATDAVQDTDGDGRSNRDEFRQRRDPVSAD